MNKHFLRTLVAATLVMGCAAASAQTEQTQQARGYVGIAAGKSHLNGDCVGVVNCDDSGSGWKLYGGYKLSPSMALEVNWVDFGKARSGAAENGRTTTAEIKSRALGVGLAFEGEIVSRVSLLGRFGLANMRSETIDASGAKISSASGSEVKPYAGLGVGFAVTPQVVIHAAWDISNSMNENRRLDLLSLGAAYKF